MRLINSSLAHNHSVVYSGIATPTMLQGTSELQGSCQKQFFSSSPHPLHYISTNSYPLQYIFTGLIVHPLPYISTSPHFSNLSPLFHTFSVFTIIIDSIIKEEGLATPSSINTLPHPHKLSYKLSCKFSVRYVTSDNEDFLFSCLTRITASIYCIQYFHQPRAAWLEVKNIRSQGYDEMVLQTCQVNKLDYKLQCEKNDLQQYVPLPLQQSLFKFWIMCYI